MPLVWYLGWMAVWELIGLAAVLTFLWFLVEGTERGRATAQETNGAA